VGGVVKDADRLFWSVFYAGLLLLPFLLWLANWLAS
jgi:hypothetical protein